MGGSTVKIAAASTFSGAVTLTDGTLTGTGDLTLSNQLTWSGGTISGTGKKIVSGALNLSGSRYLDGTTLETNGATIWTGAGYLYGYNGAIWNNTSTGTIDLQGDGDFYLASGTPSFNNAGTFTKSNGATNGSDYSYFDVAFNNTGTVEIKKGKLNLAGGYTQTAGTTRLNGGNLASSSFDLKGGVLTGAGTITGNVNNTGGQVNPGNTVGTLVIDGNYSQSGTGLLNFDLASASSFDKFNVTGEGTFGGTLKVSLGTGYTPTIGTKYTVLTYGTATAKTFNTVQGIDLSTSLALAPTSTGNNLILEVVDKVPDLGAVSFGNTKSFTDAVGDSDLFDFYRFNVSAADTVQLKLTNLTANADIWLVDGLGRTLTQGTQTGTADEVVSWAVDAGTYFVKVFRPAAGNNTNYTLQVATTSIPAVITVAATDASAAETATGVTPNPGTFTLTRTGDLSQAITVNYTLAGTATNGTDYTNLPLTANFVAGASTALVTVTPTDDALAEATENVVLTLATGTGYSLGTAINATVNIADNETPVVTIAATDASAAETATGVTPNPGTFTLTRLGNLASALTVNYTVTGSATNGTDYTTIPLTATFAAGASTVLVTVNPTDDSLAEATENVVLTLATGTGYSLGTTTSATVNIADNEIPLITVAATDASAAETATGVTPNPGTFTLTRLGNLASALTVNYTVTGSATNGTDYTNIPLTATFLAGASTAVVTVTPTDDTLAEATENVVLTLATGTGYSLGTTTSATVNIADNETPVITVAATDASAVETATGVTPNLGTFTLTRLGNLASALTVNYTLAGTATNGTDYTTIPLTATFAAGSNTALVSVSPIDDSSFEGTETVILNLGTGTGYTLGTTASATVNIDDNDTAGSAEITVSATDASAAETATGVTPNPGTFTFARTGNTISALTVNYTLSGTAINDSDYTSLAGTVTFAANASTATVNVNPLDDTIFETSTPETVILTLATGTGYTLGTAKTGTVSITDNDSQPIINLSASQTVVEGFTSPQTVSYTVTLANASSQAITVNYATANGTALAGSDYTSTSGTLTFNAGVTSQVINIPILNDSLNETNETFTLSLTSPTNATLGTSTVTTTITDTLTASVTTTLPANVENLTLTGTAVADGTGNAGANVLTGNSANNILAGLDGNDTYAFVANSLLGIDTINETATGGTDTLDFTGTNGPIRLNLGVTTNQTVVTSNLTLKLSAIDGIENVYGGNGSDRLTGNNLSNALYGNGGADSLSGGGGADSLVGGAGDDLLGGGAGNDSFVYSTGKAFLNTDLGLDTLLDFTTTADKLVLSKATFTALTSAIGNGFSQGTEFAIVDDDALAGGSSAFIVYSSNSGSLFYNQNGNASGLGTGAEFAVLFGIPTLSSGDFSLAA
jgi:Ca2+-binding RTX toxin-like protein